MILSSENLSPLKCTILHRLPNRIRLACLALGYLENFKVEMHKRISGIDGIASVSISTLTKNMLIHYDQKTIIEEVLIEAIENVIGQYAINAYQNDRITRHKKTVKERNLHEESISSILFKLGLTAGLMLYAAVKPKTGVNQKTKLLSVTNAGVYYLMHPLLKSGLTSLKEDKKPNADTLEVIAIMASLFSGKQVSSLTILLLHNIAELMTVYAMNRTKNAIRKLLSVDSEYVWKKYKDGSVKKIPVDDIELNDIIIAHIGEKISVDGVITEGNSLIDQSAITGENMPASKKKGDSVFAGTIVRSGTVEISATAVGDKTAVGRIIDMVENAPNKKASIQNNADRLSEVLIPINLLLFILVWGFTKDFAKALNMLVIDYSCGIRLSTAAALTASINTAARHNVLIKGSNVIEDLTECDTLILDKTGTLTKGKPEVVSILPVNSRISEMKVLEYAAAAEETSTHPVASSILNKLRSKGGKISVHGRIKVTTGRGVETKIGQKIIRVGNKRFMNECGLHTHPLREQVTKLSLAGENVVFVARNQEVIGVIGIRDPLRENMRKSINRLRINAGIDDIILLTGDLEQQAEVVSNRLGMDRYDSELMPDDKARVVLELQGEGCKVAMVGDGINDAPALAYADVGIAMGTVKTDIAMETADVTIASDNPLMLPAVYSLSKATMGVIKQNFAVSIGINTLGLLLGGTGKISVLTGALLHNSSTILVIGNSLRILFHDMNRRN